MERERLVAELSAHGIRFLAGGADADMNVPARAPSELIAALAQHRDPRLRSALTSLFLLHSDWGADVPRVAQILEGAARIELCARYMAAVYLQRMWRTRLGFYLADFSLLPDYFSAALGLPPADERFGKPGLHALAEWHARRSEFPYNRVASYEKALELLIGQLKAEARHHEFAAAR